MTNPIDFDGDALKLFQSAWDSAEEYQAPRDQQFNRDYQNFHAFLDTSLRNPNRSNVTIPKIRAIIMTKGPREIKAAIGRRPYIPFDSQRSEYSTLAQLQSKMLDQQLYLAGFFNEFVCAALMKLTYGTSFMEAVPYFKTEYRKVVEPIMEPGPNGEPVLVDIKQRMTATKLMRLSLRAFAPWEIKVDPFASGLENEGQCRYVIKVRITSKRIIKKMCADNAYPGFDVAKLDAAAPDYGSSMAKHRGHDMLASMGMTQPRGDSDLCVLFNYESPERYIDIVNDGIVLRDRPNPYAAAEGGHGLINLSRLIHGVDPHTQARFWGNGEAKALEILQALLNDLWNITIDNHNFGNQGMTYFATGRGVTPEKLVHAIGNKIGFDLPPDQRIQDVILETYGHPLPPDHYALKESVLNDMDLTSNLYPVSRGEASPGEQTLGEIERLKQAGDESGELYVKNIENPFLTDFGHKCLCHIDQFATQATKIDLLGDRDAKRVALLNPKDLPGGYDFTFTGSDRIVNQIIKQRNLDTLDKSMQASPYTKQREWLVEKLTVHELGDRVDDLLKTEEELQTEQMQQAQAAMQMRGQQAQVEAEGQSRQNVEKYSMDIGKMQAKAQMDAQGAKA